MLSRCRTIRIQKASAVLKRGTLSSSPNGVSVSEDAGHPRLPFVDSAPPPCQESRPALLHPRPSRAITPTMNTLQLRNSFLLLLTAVIWGVAFVAQSVCGPLHVYLRALLYRRPVPHSLHRAAQQAEPLLPRRHQAFERENEGPALDRRRVLRCDALLRKLFSADRHHVHVRGQGGVHYGLLYHHRPAPRAVLQKTVRPVRLARRGAGHRRPLFSSAIS